MSDPHQFFETLSGVHISNLFSQHPVQDLANGISQWEGQHHDDLSDRDGFGPYHESVSGTDGLRGYLAKYYDGQGGA